MTENTNKEIINMADVDVEEIRWLWYPYIPYGKCTILQGDPGCGKTMLALNLAARLSNGYGMPFSSAEPEGPIHILYQTSEDGIGDTIKPRLLAASANCNNIRVINEESNPLHFDDERIEKAIVSENARLLILDPLSAYIGENVNLNQAIDVRSAFRKIYAVAQRTKCAVLIVSHMNKANGISALYRTNGSIDICGAVRSILTVCEDREEKDKRFLVPVKSNLAEKGDAIIFRLSDHIEWLESRAVTADELLSSFGSNRDTKQGQAEEELLALLSEEDKPAYEIYNHFEKLGISKRTVENAKKSLGVKSHRKSKVWMWSLE